MWIGVLWFKTYTKDSDHRVGKEKEAPAATMMRMMLAYTALQRACYGGTAAFMHFSVWLAAFSSGIRKKTVQRLEKLEMHCPKPPEAARSRPMLPDAARCCPMLPEAARSCPKLPEAARSCPNAACWPAPLPESCISLRAAPCPKLPEAARSCPMLPEAARSCPMLPEAARRQICAAPHVSVRRVPEPCETKENRAAPSARTLFLP